MLLKFDDVSQDQELVRRFESMIELAGVYDCWMWQGPTNGHGYGCIAWDGRVVMAHRLSLVLKNEVDLTTEQLVLHSCDVRGCVNAHHLRSGTHGENMKDMTRRGRSAKGEKQGSSKLKENQVVAILKEYATERTPQRVLANKFGVSKTLIAKIVRRELWGHVEVDVAGLLEDYRHSNRHVRLSPKKAREIRLAYATGGFTYKQLAKEFFVHYSIIGDVVNGTLWRTESDGPAKAD